MTFPKRHGVDEELFHSGFAAVKIDSPFTGEIGKGVKYFARQVYGGYDLYTAEGKKVSHVSTGSGNAARVAASIYDPED